MSCKGGDMMGGRKLTLFLPYKLFRIYLIFSKVYEDITLI